MSDRTALPRRDDSTTTLLERARAGDTAAIEALFARSVPILRRWARGRLPAWARDATDTEDVVQEAVLQTFKHLETFDARGEGALQAYLRQAVLNRIRDLIRGARRHGVAPDVVAEPRDWKPSPLEAAIMGQQLERFLAALGQLRPSDRQLIIWRIELGYTTEEIAARLGKSKAAAGMSVTRALARLAKELNLDPPPSS